MLASGGEVTYPLFLTVQNDITAAIAAAVPVTTANCLLGDGNFSGGQTSSFSNNRLYMERFKASYSGEITNIKAHCLKSANMKVAIYSDNSNIPNGLLAESVSTAVVSGENRIPLVSPLSVTKDTYYWIVFNQSAIGVIRYINTGDVTRWVTSVYANAFPETMPETASFNASIAISAWRTTTEAEDYII